MAHFELETLPGLRVPLLRSEAHDCPYVPGRVASNLYLVNTPVSDDDYVQLMAMRFRRSGALFYRPSCPACEECVPIRVPVATFRATRSQRRALRKNADVRVEFDEPSSDAQRIAVYERYQRFVHDKQHSVSEEEYEMFFRVSPLTTREMSYWLHDELVGVGLVDVTPDGLSSVYFYYDPAFADRSLGKFSALCEIEQCRRLGLPHWYLGFYVRGCDKMEYKAEFRPHQLLTSDGWRSM